MDLPQIDGDRLKRRILARIRSLETCSHALCSMSESVGEDLEARSLKRLLCVHPTWQVFNGTGWMPSPKVKVPGGCYCTVCGAADYEDDEPTQAVGAVDPFEGSDHELTTRDKSLSETP